MTKKTVFNGLTGETTRVDLTTAEQLEYDNAVTDFPEPDSPTTATVSPLFICQDTPSTAFTVLSFKGKWTFKSLISIIRSLFMNTH